MDGELFLMRVANRLGLSGPGEAQPIAGAVLSTLGEGLSRPVAETVAADLPAPLGEALLAGPHGATLGLERLYARVAERTGGRPSMASEEALVVLGVLAEALRSEMVQLIRGDVPAEVGALLRRAERAEPSEAPHLHPEDRSLAEGRPGSHHPLATARPDRAQSESVVLSTNPHGATKLSTAQGLRQEQEHRTLAEGRPGSERPLSTAHPGHPAPFTKP